MDARLIDILVCPLCKGPLVLDKLASELICKGDKLAYPIRDGIPIMWADQARDLSGSPVAASGVVSLSGTNSVGTSE